MLVALRDYATALANGYGKRVEVVTIDIATARDVAEAKGP